MWPRKKLFNVGAGLRARPQGNGLDRSAQRIECLDTPVFNVFVEDLFYANNLHGCRVEADFGPLTFDCFGHHS